MAHSVHSVTTVSVFFALLLTDCSYWGGNGPSVYGGQSGLTEDYAMHADETGIGALRINFRIDGRQTWDDALLAQYDAYVQTAREHRLDVLGTILYESTPLRQVDWNNDPDGDGVNPYVQTFVDVAKLLLARYGDSIKNWEIWNEPNCYSNSNYRNDPQHAGCYYTTAPAALAEVPLALALASDGDDGLGFRLQSRRGRFRLRAR